MDRNRLNIVSDRNIPFIDTPLESIGQVSSLPADKITPEVMADADVLITRTRTRCDASLLEGSPCRFIGTATIGTDHIDLPWCEAHGITVANAPGCNAPAVAQWVLAAIRDTLPEGRGLDSMTLGVIGAGNVGSILIRWARSLGMRVLVNDPPQQARALTLGSESRFTYSTLAEIARECDVITVHTPLTRDGDYPTYHLIDREFIDTLQRSPMIINAARGPVTDTQALLYGLRSGKISAVAIDCWEGEPAVNTQLLALASIATPHIAGYSREGKTRASQMVLDTLSNFLKVNSFLPHDFAGLKADAPALNPIPATITADRIGYPTLLAETATLKADPSRFEHLRNTYPLRPEPI